MASPYETQRDLTIRVLDPAGALCRAMTFPPRETISIGRSSDSDLVLKDFGSRISRCHAAILNDGQHWEFYSLGVNGTFCDGRKIDILVITSGATVRLGRSGPSLQFSLAETPQDDHCGSHDIELDGSSSSGDSTINDD